MCSLIRKSAVLLLILLPLASGKAELKRVPLILMDTGEFDFPDSAVPTANLTGTGASTHLGQIESVGVFKSLGPGPPGRFKGEIQGEAIAVALDTELGTPNETATATSGEMATARSKQDSIRYLLTAEFRPDASGIFYGIGTYVITGGTGKFKRARGFGEFIGLANFPGFRYNCFLRGVISY